MLRVGMSYHGGTPSYDYYAAALHRAADEESLELHVQWLSGHNSEPDGSVAQVDGIVMTGGADVDPASYGSAEAESLCETDHRRDRIERLLFASWQAAPVPLLAICRGEQLLNVIQGGTLIPDLGERNGVHRRAENSDKRHPVVLAEGSLLAAIAGGASGTVHSSHHQAVDRIADAFHVTATAPDGTIEGYEWAEGTGRPFLLAVQWHPERMAFDERLAGGVMRAFVCAVAAARV